MLLEPVVLTEVLKAAVAGVCCKTVVVSEAADLMVHLARKALEVGDETPVLLVQQQEDLSFDLQGRRRGTKKDREALRQPFDDRQMPLVDVDAQSRIEKLHALKVLDLAAAMPRQSCQVEVAVHVLRLPSLWLAAVEQVGQVLTPAIVVVFVEDAQLPGDEAAPEALVVAVLDVEHALLREELRRKFAGSTPAHRLQMWLKGSQVVERDVDEMQFLDALQHHLAAGVPQLLRVGREL